MRAMSGADSGAGRGLARQTAIAAFLLWPVLAFAETSHEGKGWSTVVGDDGLLKSLKVAQCEMLRPFPDRLTACAIYEGNADQPELKFDSVKKGETGAVEARSGKLALEYVFMEDALKIRCRSFSRDQPIVILWRPSAEVLRAVDGEDDTSVDTEKTWYDDMVNGRWIAGSGQILTVLLKGHWTRLPYTAQGAPCFGTTIYPMNEMELVFKPHISPDPATALVFEIKGENEDFLPPGGGPAIFPCKAENLSPSRLDAGYKVVVRQYASRSQVLAKEGKFSVEPAARTTVPVALELKEPGVYRGEMQLLSGGKVVREKAWNFCYDFANWRPKCPRPEDFDQFWRETLEELSRVPADLEKKKVSDDQLSALYRISYEVLNRERAFAWLRIPKGERGPKFPARLQFPASGVNVLPAPAPSGFVEMYLAIHGFDVDKSDFPSAPPYPWPGARYHNVGLEKKETYFYRNVYARCARAVDVLASLAEVDGGRIMVYGGSQGGGLAVVAAALRPEVALCASGFPGLCRLDWTVEHEVGSWPLSKADIPEGQTLEEMQRTLSYFDVANFVGDVKCPIVASIGWMDTVTAAGGQLAALAQANRDRLTVYCAPWGRHGADQRTQSLFYRSHQEFLAGTPVSLPRAWLQRSQVR